MLNSFGQQHWWPVTEEGEIRPTYKKRSHLTEQQKFEICAGAILTQNTDWKNAMLAFENLNKAKMLSCKKIANAKQAKIASLIRSSGYYHQKTEKLKKFCSYIQKNYEGNLKEFFSKPLPELRAELLSLHGIGNETADDIVLYAAEKPSFVVDAYTLRFVERFYAKQGIGYVEVKQFFESQLPMGVQLFNEFHALLVEHGKRYCGKQPLCSECFFKTNCRFNK
ncbi:MAG: endonuclease III domain-containing protein [Candidatus Diapherotrites archaeon]|nr:endonuclease III domain-containing protein [Candidatus Diapherotrites archaeon]